VRAAVGDILPGPMELNRREFLVATATLAAAASVPVVAGTQDPPIAREPVAWLHGDPYLAGVIESPLAGRDFYEIRHQALRFRTTAEDRDRYVLGLEFPHA
jgi:hypothetical protein